MRRALQLGRYVTKRRSAVIVSQGFPAVACRSFNCSVGEGVPTQSSSKSSISETSSFSGASSEGNEDAKDQILDVEDNELHETESEESEKSDTSDYELEEKDSTALIVLNKIEEDDQSYRTDRGQVHLISVKEVCRVLTSLRARDVQVINVKDRCDWTDYMIFATGRSTRHLIGMADMIVHAVKKKSSAKAHNFFPTVEGRASDSWMLVDCGSIVVHVFSEEARLRYRLEDKWSGADVLFLPEGEEEIEVEVVEEEEEESDDDDDDEEKQDDGAAASTILSSSTLETTTETSIINSSSSSSSSNSNSNDNISSSNIV